MIYTPDVWVKLEITSKQYGSVERILAGWYGGWAGSDSWKLNSGIVSITETAEAYVFAGVTGSTYVCHKTCQKLSSYTSGVLESLSKTIKENGASIKIVKHV